MLMESDRTAVSWSHSPTHHIPSLGQHDPQMTMQDATIQYISQNNIDVLSWPSVCPDVSNRIMWGEMECRHRRRHLTNHQQEIHSKPYLGR